MLSVRPINLIALRAAHLSRTLDSCKLFSKDLGFRAARAGSDRSSSPITLPLPAQGIRVFIAAVLIMVVLALAPSHGLRAIRFTLAVGFAFLLAFWPTLGL